MATKTKTIPWDPAERLTDKKAIMSFLNAALEDGDPAVIAAALGTVARAQGMTRIARDAGPPPRPSDPPRPWKKVSFTPRATATWCNSVCTRCKFQHAAK